MKRMMLAWLIAGSLPIAAFAVNGSWFDGGKNMDFGSIKPVAISYPGPVTLPASTQCTAATYAAIYQKAVETEVRTRLFQYLQSIGKPVRWETMTVVGNSSIARLDDSTTMNAIGNGLSVEMTAVDGTLLLARPEHWNHVVSQHSDYYQREGAGLMIFQNIPLSMYGNYASTICSMDAVVDERFSTDGTWFVQNEGNPSTNSPATHAVIASLQIHFHQATCLGACSANPT